MMPKHLNVFRGLVISLLLMLMMVSGLSATHGTHGAIEKAMTTEPPNTASTLSRL